MPIAFSVQVQVLGGVAVAVALAMGAGGAVAVAGAEDGGAPAPVAPVTVAVVPETTTSTSSTTTTTTSTTTSTTTTTTTAPAPPPAPEPAAEPEPEPEPAPAPPAESLDPVAPTGPEAPPGNPREDVPVVGTGHMWIPAIGMDHEIYEGVSLTVIDVGPGHWPGTPNPGGTGNVVVGGHRVTHSHPFRDLDQLHPGDQISFEMYDGTTATYSVVEQFVVNPDAMWIVDPTPTNMLTLFACHPKGSARQRIVVRAELVG